MIATQPLTGNETRQKNYAGRMALYFCLGERVV
ncbi:hypothetical protein ACP0HM_31245 [Escherichia coli]